MNNLIVITYKRPATEIDKKLYGTETEYFWDSEAFHDDSLADYFVNRAKSRYEDVNVFKCSFADYMNFVDNSSAYAHFEQTGEHNLQIIEEDVEVGTEAQTERIQLLLEMSRESETNSFDYAVDVDDVGQIVLTPKDEGTSFVSIQRLAGYDSTEEIVEGNTKKFALSLDANMLAENDNFDWFVDIDEVGQAVITPDAEDTSFLTVSVNDSLNLVTESAEASPIEIDEEEVSTAIDTRAIADKIIRGDIPLYSYDGEPDASYAHIEELDHQDKLYLFRYYYDPESNSAISYHTKVVDDATESEHTLTEAGEDSDMPQWKVTFDTTDGSVEEIFEANRIDDAVMLAEQHIRMMSLKGENPDAWKSARITSATSISG